MLPIFDPKGSAVAWLKDNLLFSINGGATAFMNGESVINYAGAHCGFLKDCFFRDHGGNIVAFLKGASGWPRRPVTKAPPMTPLAGTAPLKPFAPMTPVRAPATLNWSNLSWEQFIAKSQIPISKSQTTT